MFVQRYYRGKKCNIVWCVDYNKAYHVNPRLIDNIILGLKVHFGGILITREKKHPFLGMNIEIAKENKIETDVK